MRERLSLPFRSAPDSSSLLRASMSALRAALCSANAFCAMAGAPNAQARVLAPLVPARCCQCCTLVVLLVETLRRVRVQRGRAEREQRALAKGSSGHTENYHWPSLAPPS